jgi:hypothetical protein
MGFACMACPAEKRAVTRTRRGMVTHLLVVHRITIQRSLDFEGEENASARSQTK